MARKIVVFSTKTNKSSSVMSDATTWGQLKDELSSVLNEEMVATIVETKNQLVSNDALLPEGEFKLVLTPAKTKSGGEIIDIASVFAEFREKVDAAFEEVLQSIENGNHSSTGLSSSEDDELKREAEKIRRELSL